MPRMKTQNRKINSGWSRATVAPAPLKLEEKPIRGVKLKTVSAFTMFFALACLAAFMAGRVPVISADSEQTAAKGSPMFLGLMNATYQAKDLNAAKAWYAKALGIQPYFDQPFYVGFNVHGYELGLVPETAATEKRAASGVAYWRVEDASAAYQKLIELGATPREPVQNVGGDIFVGTVHDPFGNVLGVIQNPHFKPE
jgi:predicted enzyme related to lactoylglutathione lyase